MQINDRASNGAETEHRHRRIDHELAGVSVRGDDVEPVSGIRRIAMLFRGMAILLVVMMVLQIFFAATSTVPLSPGVVAAEAVRLLIFAGLLWGVGDLAVLFVKSHHDLRATRILTARVAHLTQQHVESAHVPQAGPSRPGREI